VESGAPLELDDIPDVSGKLAQVVAPDSGEVSPVPGRHQTSRRPIIAHAADTSGRIGMAASSHSPMVGGAFAARSQPRSRVPIIAGIGGVLGVLLTIWLATRPSKASDNKPNTTVPVPASRYAKFTTEPADSRILVNGSEGHIGTPWKVALTDGQHQVEISREGYKTWTRDIEVEAGETQNFHVVLEQLKLNNNSATLRMRPSPLHFDAEVDGKPVLSGTPFEMELAPGIHRIVLRKNGTALWRHELTASAATTYELAPTVNERRRDDPDPRVVANVAPRSSSGGTGSGSSSAGSDSVSSGSGSAGAGVTVASLGSGATASSIGQVPEPAVTRPPPVTPSPVVPPPVVPRPPPLSTTTTPIIPVKPPQAPLVAAGPVPISSSAVKRVSGDAPNLRTLRMDDLPKVISAKMCIDTSGSVTSVSILQSIDNRFVRELQNTLKKWRYTPYKLDGTLRAACFVVPMRTK
jgi:PEGA domain